MEIKKYENDEKSNEIKDDGKLQDKKETEKKNDKEE